MYGTLLRLITIQKADFLAIYLYFSYLMMSPIINFMAIYSGRNSPNYFFNLNNVISVPSEVCSAEQYCSLTGWGAQRW